MKLIKYLIVLSLSSWVTLGVNAETIKISPLSLKKMCIRMLNSQERKKI